MHRFTYFICLMVLTITILTNARTLQVGPSRPIKTIVDAAKSVQSGDTVDIDTGLYTDVACTWSANNTFIRGAAKFAHLKAPAVIANQKAILVISGSNTTVENIEFSDAKVPDRNGAGIRQEGSNVTIRNCYFHHCENGILGGSGYVAIENSEFAFCGYGDGYSHNMYISSCDSFLLRFCYTHDASEGHTIKSRAFKNYILYNRIESATSTTSYEINLPNAGTSIIIGNQIQQGPDSHNATIIDYGSEGLSGHDTALYIINNTVVNDRSSGTFISVRGTQNRPKVYNNIFVGSGTICTIPTDTAGNYIGNAPGFIDRANFDYRLSASSPAIHRGVDPGSAGDFSLVPAYHYAHPTAGMPRVHSGNSPDAGAYAYSDAGVALHWPVNMHDDAVARINKAPVSRYDLTGRRLSPCRIGAGTSNPQSVHRASNFRMVVEIR